MNAGIPTATNQLRTKNQSWSVFQFEEGENVPTSFSCLQVEVNKGLAHAVSKISDCQPEVPGFKPRPGRELNFGRPSFATPSVDRDVKPLV